MSLLEDLKADVKKIIETSWTERDGTVVPKTEEVKLNNGAVELEATMLYSDLVHSTNLTMTSTNKFAAEIYKCFLSCASRIIKDHSGYIRSFDGDRVMGVFIGKSKNTSAVSAALEISYAVEYIIIPKVRAFYKSRKNFSIKHCTGIDTSSIYIVRGGVPIDNDLVWIGRAPNVAAKLSAIRNNKTTYITDTVFSYLNRSRKSLADANNNNRLTPIWTEYNWSTVSGIKKIYGTDWNMIIE